MKAFSPRSSSFEAYSYSDPFAATPRGVERHALTQSSDQTRIIGPGREFRNDIMTDFKYDYGFAPKNSRVFRRIENALNRLHEKTVPKRVARTPRYVFRWGDGWVDIASEISTNNPNEPRLTMQPKYDKKLKTKERKWENHPYGELDAKAMERVNKKLTPSKGRKMVEAVKKSARSAKDKVSGIKLGFRIKNGGSKRIESSKSVVYPGF